MADPASFWNHRRTFPLRTPHECSPGCAVRQIELRPGRRRDHLDAERHEQAHDCANLSGLAVFATDRTFSPGLPLFLTPAPLTGLASNTFDLHARQSNIFAQFTGDFRSHPWGHDLVLFYNDNITADNYGFLLYYAYGELKNDQMRFAAESPAGHLQPRGPHTPVAQFALWFGQRWIVSWSDSI